MASFGNKRKDFSIRPPRQQVDGTPFFVTDSANIDFTLENLNLTANLTATGILAGTYGNSTTVPVITLDVYGRVTGITTAAIPQLLLQTNSIDNPIQTLLNLIAGTNMTITDDGLGNITFDATGGSGGTYTVDNGLTESPANNFQLGGPLVQNTDLTNSSFYLRFTQSAGKALELYSNDAEALLTQRANTSRNTVDTVARLVRRSTTNPLGIWTQSGFGAALDFDLMMSNGATVTAGSIAARWNSPISPVESSFLTFSTRNAGVLAIQMTLDNNGILGLTSYGTGAFVGAPAYSLGVDASGNVVEFTASPTTGDSVSPFLLMGG
jgi:hypothetical protein